MVATECIVAEHGSFNHIRQVAPVCTYLIQGFLGKCKCYCRAHHPRVSGFVEVHNVSQRRRSIDLRYYVQNIWCSSAM